MEENMKNLFLIVALIMIASEFGQAQRLRAVRHDIKEARQEAVRDARESKQGYLLAASKNKYPETEEFYDPNSFGRNVKFLGSFYAGTLYVYRSCDPQILLDEVGLVLAADDKCAAHTLGSPMATTEVFDTVWQITIPRNAVDNVIYPMLNNGIGFDSFANQSGVINFIYSPRLTIESEALNDPSAIDPNTGLPMNGSFTTSLAGSRVRSFSVTAGDFQSDYSNNSSVASRGLSRDYFAALGLPQSVINRLFNRPMTLKFGIRARVSGPVEFAQFFYTFRLLGN